MAEARALADELARKPSTALRYTIEAVNHGGEMPFHAGQTLEASLFGILMETVDKGEGVSAFLSKRPPRFG